jgi:hypothetical protein
MQICVQDVFDIKFSCFMCYDTVSTYDTTLTSLINCCATSDFHDMHDTTYDTPIVTSLSYLYFKLPIPQDIYGCVH